MEQTSTSGVGQLAFDPPQADRDWLIAVRRQWDQVWAQDSPIARHILTTDLAALQRLFDWRDQQLRARKRATRLWKVAEAEPTVEGSKGQTVPNGLFDVAQREEAQALSIETRIVALEDRLGLNPKARLNLGLTQLQGMSLAAANAEIAAALMEGMASGAPDPRSLHGDAPAAPG